MIFDQSPPALSFSLRSSFVQTLNDFLLRWTRLTASSLFFCAGVAVADPAVDGPIASMRRIDLGGVQQAILIRGDSCQNPILLVVHGGPGLPEMLFSYRNKELEHDFLVVHWDQRGAGKSYRANTPEITTDQIVSDALQLSHYLRGEFHRKIYLAGYSWGSLVALKAVAREPDLFEACIGISQLVNIPASERELDVRSRKVAQENGDTRALAELERLGHYPYANHRDERKVNKIQKKLMGQISHDLSQLHTVALALVSPYYTPADISRTISGLSFSGRALEKEIYTANLFTAVPEIDVPIYFFVGRRDTVLSPIVAHRYFERLIAPRGKHFIWFEDSNHWPQMEEPAFYREMMRRVLRETSRHNSSTSRSIF